ncbi:MAG: hypothetical protein IKH90_07100 [Ruminococcus sp.]|nr:hypothetical protein [Ruminococcus sp.]
MDKNISISAIKDFMSYCKAKEGIEIKAEVEVYDDTELIHQGSADVYCSYDVGYMQYRVTIIWCFDDAVMKKMGLHGSYNTNFQEFTYTSGVLTIIDNNIKINISKE